MVSESELLRMFLEVHGDIGPTCSAICYYDDNGFVQGVQLMKYGNVAWRHTIAEILFCYTLKGLE